MLLLFLSPALCYNHPQSSSSKLISTNPRWSSPLDKFLLIIWSQSQVGVRVVGARHSWSRALLQMPPQTLLVSLLSRSFYSKCQAAIIRRYLFHQGKTNWLFLCGFCWRGDILSLQLPLSLLLLVSVTLHPWVATKPPSPLQLHKHYIPIAIAHTREKIGTRSWKLELEQLLDKWLRRLRGQGGRSRWRKWKMINKLKI